jgi:hypothetical protein
MNEIWGIIIWSIVILICVTIFVLLLRYSYILDRRDAMFRVKYVESLKHSFLRIELKELKERALRGEKLSQKDLMRMKELSDLISMLGDDTQDSVKFRVVITPKRKGDIDE